MQLKKSAVMMLLIATSVGLAAPVTAQTKRVEGDAAAGRALALSACTGCHIVASDQPFNPEWTGTPRPPDFKTIANRADVTAASLQHHLETLPTVPRRPGMANPDLSTEQLRNVAAFILTLRDSSPSK